MKHKISTLWAVVRKQQPDFPLPQREYQFTPERKWRFDHAIPELKLAFEINGQVHRIKEKSKRDWEKLNAAQIKGWMVIQLDNSWVENLSCIDVVIKAFLAAKEKIA